jgi:hypothetical protein
LILTGDHGTVEYQLKQEMKLTPKEGFTKKPFYENQKSVRCSYPYEPDLIMDKYANFLLGFALRSFGGKL